MRTILLGICIIICSVIAAQGKCGSSEYIQRQKDADFTTSQKISVIENFQKLSSFNSLTATQKENGSTIIRIPVVVHILYKTPNQDIDDIQVKSQIDALNRDYRRQNADTINTPLRFKAFAADTHIEFALATADITGRATTGIIHKQTNIPDWNIDDKIKLSEAGGDNAWDNRYYLNIWVGNLSGVLGYSSFPGCEAYRDGVVIDASAFGTINAAAPYNLGRTAVHEIGHWLGLKHIWGDTYCGDDLVDDTPKQGNFTAGCPGGTFRSTCENGTLGDMYMNYMDFTNDACLNLFTEGQKERMLSLFSTGAPRVDLLSSKGLDKPWVFSALPITKENPEINHSIKFYPNPSRTEIFLNFVSDPVWIGKSVSIINMNGNIESVLIVASKTMKINIAQLKPGIYFIMGSNGNVKVREKFIKL